ncbi:MAG: hypothetical protein ABJN42_11355, partial [Roseibium sp.]|uniref:hypothetical protein n=1 Tax=Roseibium sp. TaxID=1936156 RepID=UPI003297B1A0
MPNTANISVINLPVIAAAQMELDITAGTYEENISQNPNYYGVNGGFAVTPDLGDVRSDLFARGLAEGFPQGSVFRIAFNEHSFDETSGEIDANLDEILRDMSAEGMKFIFTYEKGGITDTEVDPQEALEGDLKDVMVDSYQNLARYLDKEFSVGLSTVALEVGQSRAIYDFIINTTDEGARDEKIAELSEIYAEQASAIQSVVNPYFYNSYIATGFGPDRSIEGFSDAALAQLRSAFKSDLIWGTTVPTDPDVDLDAFHAAYGDDVYFAIDNNRDGQSDTGYAWYAENNVGIAWNPSNPAANIVAADENGNVLVLDQAAYAARLEVMMGQTNAELMPDDDIVDLRSIDAEMHNAPDSPDAIVDRATVDDAGGMAIGAGYGGNDIIDGRAGFNNM